MNGRRSYPPEAFIARGGVEIGLYYYRNRYYHAQLGRFVSRDPIEYEGSQWNLYEYVNGGPTGEVDPYGLAESCPQRPALKDMYIWDLVYWTFKDLMDAGDLATEDVQSAAGTAAGYLEALRDLYTGNERAQCELLENLITQAERGGNQRLADELKKAYIAKCFKGHLSGPVAKKDRFLPRGSAPRKVPTPNVKGGGKIGDVVPRFVPPNWTRTDIQDAIRDYERSIRIRKAEAMDFDKLKGGGHVWIRKSHYERIRQEEEFLRKLGEKLQQLRR